MSSVLYYVIYSCAVIYYGFGLNRAYEVSRKPRKILNNAAKMFISVGIISSLTYLITTHLLVPYNLAGVYPFVAVLLFSTLSIFSETIVRITTKNSFVEYSVCVLSILLGVNESSSVFGCIGVSCLCIVSFLVLSLMISIVRQRVEGKTTLLVVSIAVIMLLTLTWNISWLSRGVIE